MNIEKNSQMHIIVIGGGFAGINMAIKLANNEDIKVTLVDKNNYNYFTPLLYQLATGFLDLASICLPFRTIFRDKKNLQFKMGEFQKVFPEENKVLLSSETIFYDQLVIATGTQPNYFGMDNVRKKALPMKSVNDALKLRNFLISEAEKAVQSTDVDEKKKMRNIVISGAGPSGVEVAGILAEMKNGVLREIYPELNQDKMHIYLVDGAPTVLPPMSEKSQKYSHKTLEEMGIDVQVNKMVSGYEDDKVKFKDGSHIETKTLIWTAGVVGQKLEGFPNECYDKAKRLKVNEFQQVDGLQNVYAIGDACIMSSDPNFPDGHPQLASVAKQQGEALAENFKAITREKKRRPFIYNDKGTMAIIGRNKAVADLTMPHKTLTGWPAWMGWIFVHLYLLLSYRNQVRTLWNWANSFFGKGQSQGILLGERPSIPSSEDKTD